MFVHARSLSGRGGVFLLPLAQRNFAIVLRLGVPHCNHSQTGSFAEHSFLLSAASCYVRYSCTLASAKDTCPKSRHQARVRCGLTIRSSRTCFAPPTTWHEKLAMLLAPLRKSA